MDFRGGWRLGLPHGLAGCGLVIMFHACCGVTAEFDARNSLTNPVPDSTWLWQRWSREHGLPDNHVEAVIQTREGHIWAASPTGLARYDGHTWEAFHRINVPGLLTDRIRQLEADARIGLWLTLFNGLVRWNGRAFSRQTLQTDGEWIGPSCPSTNGGVWVVTVQGLWRVRDDTRQLFTVPPSLNMELLLSVREFEGKVWLTHPYGIAWLDPLTGVFEGATEAPVNEVPRPLALEWDDRGVAWGLIQPVESPSCWLERFDGVTWTTNRNLPVHNNSRPVFLIHDRSGQFWIPGSRGKISLIRQGQRIDVPLPEAAAQDVALAMTQDVEGGLWIGTDNSGLLRLRPAHVQTLTVDHGLPNQAVWSLLEARDGSVWIGTDGGLSRWQAGRFTHWTEREGLSRNAVRALTEDADGRIWIGTGSGLNWIDQNRLHRYHLSGDWFNSKIRAVVAGRNRTVWLGTLSGLYRVQRTEDLKVQGSDAPPGSHAVSLAPAGAEGLDQNNENGPPPFAITPVLGPTNVLQPPDVLALLEDHAGTVWVGTAANGLYRVQDGLLLPFTTPDGFAPVSVWALHEDASGALWLGTERGLARIKNQRGFDFTPKHGLPYDFVSHIAQDDQGNLWLAGELGIYRLNKSQLDRIAEGGSNTITCVAYDEDDGLPTKETNGRKNQPGILSMRDGRLWFATVRGAIIMDPQQLPDQTSPPSVSFTRILALGQTVFDNAASQPTPMDTNLAMIDPRTLVASLPAGAGRAVEIHYAASTFVAADKLRFKYKLEGFEEGWTDAGARRVAQYANLAPGHYSFQVVAVNKYGVWNDTAATFTFTLAPFYWQTAWFKALAILLPLVAGYSLYRRRLAQHRRHAASERQTAISTERAEIARDLHDHLGVRLTLVQQLSESLQHPDAPAGPSELTTQKLTELARELNANLDSAVWAVQPDKDTLAGLADYLGDTFQELLDGTGIELDLDFPESLPAWPLSRTERYHLALIAIEALNNTLKHARPNLVRLRLEILGGTFNLDVTDDGCGFDMPALANSQTPRHGGRGLSNMHRRMEALGGRCFVTTAPGRGTTVSLSFSPALQHAQTPTPSRSAPLKP